MTALLLTALLGAAQLAPNTWYRAEDELAREMLEWENGKPGDVWTAVDATHAKWTSRAAPDLNWCGGVNSNGVVKWDAGCDPESPTPLRIRKAWTGPRTTLIVGSDKGGVEIVVGEGVDDKGNHYGCPHGYIFHDHGDWAELTCKPAAKK